MAGSEVQTNVDASLLEHMEDFGVHNDVKVANVINGGQLGPGYQADTLDAATPLVFMPTHLVIMSTPTMYDDRPEIGKTIKSMFETCAKSVSGIDFNYTTETASTIAGNDGQEQEVPLQTKRSAVAPSFTIQEVTGNLVWELVRQWIWDMHHPDTNAAFTGSKDPKPYTMSSYSMSMLAIQYDPTLATKNIINGAYYANMFPKGTGDLGLERTVGTSKVMERTVEFSAILFHNDYTRILARQVADDLKLNELNYNKVKTGLTIVESKLANSGLAFAAERTLKRQEA